MESILLLVIAVLLYLDIQGQRETRDETALLLQRVKQAERRIKRITDRTVVRMLDEARQDAFTRDWGESGLGG